MRNIILILLIPLLGFTSCSTSKQVKSNTTTETSTTLRSDIETLSTRIDSLCHLRNIDLDSLSLTIEPVVSQSLTDTSVISSQLGAYRIKLKAHNIRVRDSVTAINEHTVHSLQSDSLRHTAVENQKIEEAKENSFIISPKSFTIIVILVLFLFTALIIAFRFFHR